MLVSPRVLPRFFPTTLFSTSTNSRSYLIKTLPKTLNSQLAISIPCPSPPISGFPPIEIPIEKLFVPPDVDLDSISSSTSVGATVLKGSNIVLGPYGKDAQITSAEFVKSSTKTEDCPSDGLPEFALVGRSNVGKSSLLNSIVRRKKLALTSKKPETLKLSRYAAAPQEVRVNWDQFTKDYFLNRQSLVSVFLLIDARAFPQRKSILNTPVGLARIRFR